MPKKAHAPVCSKCGRPVTYRAVALHEGTWIVTERCESGHEVVRPVRPGEAVLAVT